MTVAIIGAGVMGETLLSGLIRSGTAPSDLAVGEKREERAAELRAAGDRGHALVDQCRRVRHDPDDGDAVGDVLLDQRGGDARSQRDQQLAGSQHGSDLGEHADHVLRLDDQ
ncbi:MAG: hypothetical protein EOO67_15885, partial [Microbacterium sp.]